MNAGMMQTDFTTHHIEGIAREGNVPFTAPLISQIEGNLWQGGCINGVSLGGKFKHVISLYAWERYVPGCELDSFTEVRLYDCAAAISDDTAKKLYSLAAWVNLCRKDAPTLVHCQAGLNRSGLVAGLAMVLAGREPKDAIALLRKTRCAAVLCNRVFETWLLSGGPNYKY